MNIPNDIAALELVAWLQRVAEALPTYDIPIRFENVTYTLDPAEWRSVFHWMRDQLNTPVQEEIIRNLLEVRQILEEKYPDERDEKGGTAG